MGSMEIMVPSFGQPSITSAIDTMREGQALVQTRTAFQTAMQCPRPRSMAGFVSAVREEARLAGATFFYRWEQGGKPVQGLSIAGAMAMARNYGNCALDVQVTENPDTYLFSASLIDLENGFTSTRLFRQRKSQKVSNRMDSERQEDIVFQIGQSKAIRNAIVRGMPQWLTEQAIEIAREAEVSGIDEEHIAQARSKVVDFFGGYGVTPSQIAKHVGAASVDALTKQHIADLRGIATGIKEGHISARDIFPADGGDDLAAAMTAKAQPVPAKTDGATASEPLEMARKRGPGRPPKAMAPAATAPAPEPPRVAIADERTAEPGPTQILYGKIKERMMSVGSHGCDTAAKVSGIPIERVRPDGDFEDLSRFLAAMPK